MSSNIKNPISDPKLKLARFREHLDKQIILLTDKYQLPNMIGIGKQISWAIDIRIKLVEVFDKRQSTLSVEESQRILSHIFTHNESRWWIDHKDFNLDQLLIEVFSPNINNNTKDSGNQMPLMDDKYSVIIDTKNEDFLKVLSDDMDKLPFIMNNYDFKRDELNNYWIKYISLNDQERVGVVEALSLTLLQNNFTLRIVSPPPPEVIHDGTLTVINSQLCVIARTEPVYKIISRLGNRIIWIDNKSIDKLKNLIKNYDIDCTPEALKIIGETL
ncbi:MAG: hypothetical protein PHW36_00790 [Bacilli bacterium]|nr:hypothetical protein [Bacilli bacterium]